MMKETPKRDGTVIHDDHRIGIGINTLPEPGGFKQTVEFNEIHPLEVAVLTSTATDCMFGHDDDDVPVRFSLRYIGTTPEIISKGRFDEETGKIGSKTVKKQLFLDHIVVEPSNGSNTDSFPGYSKSKTEAHDPNKDCYHTSCNQNGVSIGFCCPRMKIPPSARDFVGLADDVSMSKVNCSHSGIGMVKTMPTDCNSRVNHCGIDDLPAVEYARTTKTVVMTQCISDEWTVSEPDPPTHTTIIDHVIRICDFPSDSVMVNLLISSSGQCWNTLLLLVLMMLENSSRLEMMVLLLRTHPC
jgi:hypothetical protein